MKEIYGTDETIAKKPQTIHATLVYRIRRRHYFFFFPLEWIQPQKNTLPFPAYPAPQIALFEKRTADRRTMAR